MMTHIHRAQKACCPKGVDCSKGFPDTCQPSCAVNFHDMFHTCGAMLGGALDAKVLHSYQVFDGKCTAQSNVDVKGFMKAIGDATCCGPSHGGCVKSCKDKHQKSPKCKSGIYTICGKDGDEKTDYNVYCDMETDGGGWTREIWLLPSPVSSRLRYLTANPVRITQWR